MRKRAFLIAVGLLFFPSGQAISQTDDCPGYTYAGIRGSSSVYGISANIVARISPKLDNNPSSHSVAWIGLNHQRESWVQTGIATVGSNPQDTYLYYEIGSSELTGGYSIVFLGRVRVGESHWFAVLATVNQPNSWRVWLDGKPVSPAISLPNFSERITYAGVENRRFGSGCNEFSYEFGNVRVATAPGGVWRLFKQYSQRKDTSYRLELINNNSFRASYP